MVGGQCHRARAQTVLSWMGTRRVHGGVHQISLFGVSFRATDPSRACSERAFLAEQKSVFSFAKRRENASFPKAVLRSLLYRSKRDASRRNLKETFLKVKSVTNATRGYFFLRNLPGNLSRRKSLPDEKCLFSSLANTPFQARLNVRPFLRISYSSPVGAFFTSGEYFSVLERFNVFAWHTEVDCRLAPSNREPNPRVKS